MAASQKSVKSSKTASKAAANKKPIKDLPSVKAGKVLGGKAPLE
jgi:hypothetical protein